MDPEEAIKKRKEEIQLLVASNNVEKALKRMMDFSTDFSREQEFRSKVLNLNKMYQEDKGRAVKVAAGLLEVLDQIYQEFSI